MQRETRVHGVSGTRPRDILYTDPVTISPEDTPTKIYQRREGDPRFDTVAFHWGNLTSGSKLTAFWILLAPYALANVAGWMAGWTRDPVPGERSELARSWLVGFGHAAVRAAGMMITALFVVQSVTAGALLPLTWLEEHGQISWGPISLSFEWLTPRPAATFLFLVLGGLFYWLVAYVSTKTHFPKTDMPGVNELLFGVSGESMATEPKGGPDTADPAGAVVTDLRMWSVHTMLHRLRRLHFGMGLLVLSSILAVVTGWASLRSALILMLALSLVWSWATTLLPRARWTWITTVWTPHVAVLVFVVSLASIWLTDPADWNLESVHSLTFGIAAILGVFVALALAAGPLSVGALVIAAFFGAVLGTTIGLLVDKALHTDVLVEQGVGWVAVAMLAMIIWLALTALAVSFFGSADPARGATKPWPEEHRFLVMIRRVALEARVLFYSAGAFGLVSFAYGTVLIWTHGSDKTDSASVWDTLLAGLEPAALNRFPNWLINLGITVAILGPGYFAMRSLLRGWRGGREGEDRRRQVGILWDLGSFWPRWFHPLAPPGYGPKAVRDLRAELATGGPEMILAAHSQGSLISAVSIALEGGPTRFISYGSQLGILYPRMFPAVGIPDLVERVGGLSAAWVNLWRKTDYIGGQFIDDDRIDNRIVEEGSGHSEYELTAGYARARQDVAQT